MKKHFLILAAAVAGIMSVSCKSDNKKGPEVMTEFNPVSGTEISVGAKGGLCNLEYEIVNPTQDGKVSVEMESGIDWISDVNANTYGYVSINVLENIDTVKTRSAAITLVYEDSRINYTVTQEKAATLGHFAITVGPSTTGKITWSVTPPDDTVTYVSMAVDRETWDSFASYEEYMQYDVEFFKENAAKRELSYEEYLKKYVLKRGTQKDISVDGLSPDTDYIVYAYGMDTTGRILTGMYYAEASTLPVGQTDVTFELSVEVEFPYATVSVVPSDNEVRYLIDLYNGTGTPEEITEAYQGMLDELLYLANAFGQSTYDYMMEVSFQGQASSEIQLGGYSTSTAFAVAVDVYTGKLTSVASTLEFDIEL